MKEPLLGVMKTGEWTEASAYRVACDCHSTDHDLHVWVEVNTDQDTQDIELTLYKELYTPFWSKGFNRIREAFHVLFFGHSRHEGVILMRREVAQNFLDAVQSSIERLEKKQ